MFKLQYPNKIFTPTSLLSISDIEEFKVKLFSITAYNLVHLYLYVCLLIFNHICVQFLNLTRLKHEKLVQSTIYRLMRNNSETNKKRSIIF